MSNNDENANLENLTRTVLIFGIIFLIGGIIYQVTRPEEQDLLFFLLNENQEMRDYSTNTTLNSSIKFHVFIENRLGDSYEFSVRMYLLESNYMINPLTSVDNTQGATYIENQTVNLENKEEWISNQMEMNFTHTGDHQIILLELWQKINEEWVFIPDFMLIYRISVY